MGVTVAVGVLVGVGVGSQTLRTPQVSVSVGVIVAVGVLVGGKLLPSGEFPTPNSTIFLIVIDPAGLGVSHGMRLAQACW